MQNSGRQWAQLRMGGAPRWLLRGFATLIVIYGVQWLFIRLFAVGNIDPQRLVQPFPWLPIYIYLNWDAAWYRHFFEAYDRYFWPPLYPFSLRLVALLFWFKAGGFERSAVLLNLLSHIAIVLGIIYYLRDREDKDCNIGWVAAFLVLFYPGHNVFFAAYSESLYLALSVVAFLLLRCGRTAAASTVAGVSALVRTMGTFLVGALLLDEMLRTMRERKLDLRRLFCILPGFAIVAAWNLFLVSRGTNTVRENASWTKELIATHIGPGANPKLWVIEHLGFSADYTTVAFWAGIAALVYCGLKKYYPEMFYIFLLYFSLACYVYRPFPWSRFVSVLFPVQIMVADFLKDKPRLRAVTLIAYVALSCFVNLRLFRGDLGEP